MTDSDRSEGEPAAGVGGEPPSSGMARSIRELFDRVSPPDRERVSEGAAAEAGTELRDRFTTRVARYLQSAPDERAEMASAIRGDAVLLRNQGHLPAVAEAVVALTLSDENSDAASELSTELLDDPVATHLALRLGTERNPEVRGTLLEVAERHPVRMAPALADALSEADDRGVRRALMDALRALGDPGRNAVLGLMEDPRWYAVRNGIILLSEMADPETVASLTVPLAHDDARVRKEAVLALARIGGEEAGLLLLGMIEDPDVEVRAAAVMGVGELRVERGQRPLQELLESEDDEEVIVQLLRALGRLGDPGAVPAIEKRAVGSLFSRPSPPIRIAAYRALNAIGTPRARSLLEAAGSDKDLEVRTAVRVILKGASSSGSAVENGDPAGEPAGDDA